MNGLAPLAPPSSVIGRRAVTSVAAITLLAASISSCATSEAELDETERDESGQVVEGGDLGVLRLQVGDCVQLPSDVDDGTTQEIGAFEAIPCDEAHTGEVVLVEGQFFGDLDEFPGEDAAFESAAPRCANALDAYTGTDYDTSNFDFFTLVPTAETWDQVDDRELVCIGLTLDDDFVTPISTTGSMRAS